MDQEVWITLRFKGEASADADSRKIAENLLTSLENFIEAGGQGHGFMTTQRGDVLEIEEEASIYGNNSEAEGA
ncbi:protein of unknown function [Pseudorhizobium banfieldiae]|uniref:Uncharacterized protein n=1 Tax=Pseudorhizobium banfieldiae TaxID=1125847 RepID=L0NDK1_9HYPH|nr:hypothetical protein [Pseudorhizobium banfieldiae]CAD6606098.1 hypothetical protein RNT25_01784 [arsenite-oxidising bacterium NT-25]CCF19130.1 protein of unknown function [Pseudorhizobium banfieldiae]